MAWFGTVTLFRPLIQLVDPYLRKLGLNKLSLADNLGIHKILFGVGGNDEQGAAAATGYGVQVTANFNSTTQPAQFIYGTLRVGGMDTIPGFSSGASGVNLHRVLTLGFGAISGVTDVYLDDELLPTSCFVATAHSGYTTTYLCSSHASLSSKALSAFAGHFELAKHLGATPEQPFFRLSEAFGASSWDTFKGSGLAALGMMFTLNDNHDNYSALPQVNVIAQGLLCYDPRKDSTVAGGSGAHRFATPSTWEYSSNPIICAAHHTTHWAGGGFDYDEINWQTVMTAADVCDATVATATGTQKRYTCNGFLLAPTTSDEFIANLKQFSACCLGRIIYTNGVWEFYAGTWITPTATVDRTDWTSPPAVQFEGGDKFRFNTVLGWYNDATLNYARTSVLRTNSAYQVADGGPISRPVDLPMCVDRSEAQRRTEFILRQTRNQVSIAGDLPPRFSDLAMIQTIAAVDSVLSWSSKTFRMIGNTISSDGGYRPQFQEEQDTDWTDPTTSAYATNFSTVALPTVNALTPGVPPSLTIDQQVNGTLKFTIGRATPRPLGTRYRLIRSTNSANAAVGTVVYDGESEVIDLFVPNSSHWYYAQAYINSYFTAYFPNTFGTLAYPGLVTWQTFVNTLTASNIS